MHNNSKNIVLPEGNDFCKRFLDFVKRYEELKNGRLIQTATIWVETSNYEYIRYFLKPDPYSSLLPFSLKEFTNMKLNEIEEWHDYCVKLQKLLDEKDSLFNELVSYYK